jgi:beta-phosphoglucomutase family hydrolase
VSKLPDLINGDFDACLFDMDGVLTDTATVHATAWKKAFDAFLERRSQATGEPFVPFDVAKDYHVYVDGKPRDNGVLDFLASRDITLPRGEPTDLPGDTTAWSVGNAKNIFVVELIDAGLVKVFDDTFALIDVLRKNGIKLGVVSSSANTEAILNSVGRLGLFDERVDGNTIIKDGLTGKPAPDTFLLAAKLLGTTPERSVVFEDALSGVQAGRAGDFGLVVGVNRIDDAHAQALLQNGADISLSDLTQFINPS